MAKWLEGIESAVSGGPGGPKRVRTLRILLIVGGIGAALMIMNSFLTYKQVEPSAQDPNPPPQIRASIGQFGVVIRLYVRCDRASFGDKAERDFGENRRRWNSGCARNG